MSGDVCVGSLVEARLLWMVVVQARARVRIAVLENVGSRRDWKGRRPRRERERVRVRDRQGLQGLGMWWWGAEGGGFWSLS